jgi:LacI family transcriptional regulator
MNDRGESAQLFNDKGYPVVVVGYSQNADVPSIRSDDEHGGYIQTQHLLALGHEKIGLITGPDDDPATSMRLKRHQRAIGNSGIIANRVIGNYAVNSGYDTVANLMQQHPDVTAIAVHNDTMAIGAMQWLHQHGYRIPDDISLVGI